MGQRPRARDRVLQLQGVGQRQLQDALQIRVRAEPLQAVGAPDRPLAPAAQPPSRRASVASSRDSGACQKQALPSRRAGARQGRPFWVRAWQARRLAIGGLPRFQRHGGRARECLPARARDAVMVRRLKSHLRMVLPDGERRFPHRRIAAIEVAFPPEEQELFDLLDRYAVLRTSSASTLAERAASRFVALLLKKRLLSSPAAFKHTLDQHMKTLDAALASAHHRALGAGGSGRPGR